MVIRNATPAIIGKIARRHALHVLNLHWDKYKRGWRFSLTPASEKYQRFNLTSRGWRKAFDRFNGKPACCWHAYWLFYRDLFEKVPNAVTYSKWPRHLGNQTWNAEVFKQQAPETQLVNMGPFGTYIPYGQTCNCDKLAYDAKKAA